MEDRRKVGKKEGRKECSGRNEGSRVNARMKEGSNNKHKHHVCAHMHAYSTGYMMTGMMGNSGVVVT